MRTPLLSINNVSYRIPTLEKPILNNINYDIYPRDFVILLGSNGSGKSSLLKLLERRVLPTTGSIHLKQQPIQTISNRVYRKQVVTLTQNCHESLFTGLTLLENYILVKQQHEPRLFAFKRHQDEAFLAAYLHRFNPNLSLKLHHLTEQLSGGEKQALALALSVLYPPQILLLDEHTSALDPHSAQHLMRLTQQVITRHQITCVLTTHDLTIAQHYGNRILALREGQLFKGMDGEEKIGLNKHDLLAACY